MTRPGVRLMLLLLLFAGVGAAVWQYYRLELDSQESGREVELLDGFRDTVHEGVTRARTAQQAYLAPGQGIDFWRTQFAEAIADMTGAIENLRVTADQDAEPVKALDAADRALKVYDGLDRKVRSFVDAGNSLMAADVVYEDAIKTSGLIVSGVDDAYRFLAMPHEAAVVEHRRRQQWLSAGALGAALFVALLLLPRGRVASEEAQIVASRSADAPMHDLQLGHASVAGPLAAEGQRRDGPPRVEAPPVTPTPIAVARPVEAAVPPAVNTDASLDAAARVCTDLARVKDGEQLREALGRAARVLDASGVIVWIADASGRSLKPLLTYGYPDEALRRIPTLPRDADNATAAAWRDGTLQVVEATEAAPGAVAVPILGPQGCMGVLAAEIGHHREASGYTRAVAQIVAAQLAVLIPPDTAQDEGTSAV